MRLISIIEAANLEIERVRKPVWANQMDHIRIPFHDRKPGLWIFLHSPFNKECNGRDPVEMLNINYDLSKEEYVPYTGPLPDSEEYKAEQKKFEGVLK